MKTALIWIAVVAALWGLHRLFWWMEDRGWINYARRKHDPASIGSAFLELQKLAEPGKQHVIQVKRTRRVKREASGKT